MYTWRGGGAGISFKAHTHTVSLLYRIHTLTSSHILSDEGQRIKNNETHESVIPPSVNSSFLIHFLYQL